MYATRWCFLSSCCVKHPPIAKSDASVSIRTGFLGLNIRSTGCFKYSLRSSSNAACSFFPYDHIFSPLVKFVSGIAFLE